MESRGIVIYRLKHKGKAVLLDEHMGTKEVCFGSSVQMTIGQLIQYTEEIKKGICFIQTAVTENMPLVAAREDIFFLHHVYELVYSFMPYGKCTEGIFDHILFLYAPPIAQFIAQARWKKIFIARLLFLMGIYKEEHEQCLAFFHTIRHLPIDRIDIHYLDLAFEEALNSWLRDSSTYYQKLNELHTTYFINRYRNL